MSGMCIAFFRFYKELCVQVSLLQFLMVAEANGLFLISNVGYLGNQN